MSKSNICIILVVLAIAIAGGVFMYVYKPNMEDKESLDSEIATLETRYNELKAQEVHRDEYIALTAEYNEKFMEEIDIFPATLDQEISVMFMKGLEKDQGNLMFEVNSVGLGKEELFYTLGAGAGAAAATEDSDTVITATNSSYDCYRATFPINYTGSYEGVKDLINYIMNYKYRMNITSINIAYDPAVDVCTGSIILNAYCVTGGDRQPDTVNPEAVNGVDNVFLGGSGAVVAAAGGSSTVSASSNDVRITINNANNDTTAGIVASAGNSSAAYTENDVVTADLTVEEDEDGKVTGTLSLDGEDIDVELAEGATSFRVYIKSSGRVDSDYTNGI